MQYGIMEKNKLSTLFIPLFLGAVLFLNQAWVPGMFMDGTLYAALAKHMAQNGLTLVPEFLPNALPQFFEHPPFYLYFLAGVFKMLGASWSAARLSSFILVAISCLFLWRFIKKETDEKLAFLTLLLLFLCFSFVKKARIPLFDIPLMTFCLLSLLSSYRAIKTSQLKEWLWTGLFFGLGLLMKGPPALIIPSAIGLHLLATRKIKILLTPWPWAGLILGLALFGIWPLALLANGHFEGFEIWFNKQFLGTIIEGRDRGENNYFLYIEILLKGAFLCSLPALYGMMRFYKERENKSIQSELFVFFLCWFLGGMIPLSLMKWKYSHYIIPLYPAFAFLGAYGLYPILQKNFKTVEKIVLILTCLFAIGLLAFPLTTAPRRNKEVIGLMEDLERRNIYIKNVSILDDVLPFWDTASHLKFGHDIQTYRHPIEQLAPVEVDGIFSKDRALENSRYLPYLKDRGGVIFYLKRNLFP